MMGGIQGGSSCMYLSIRIRSKGRCLSLLKLSVVLGFIFCILLCMFMSRYSSMLNQEKCTNAYQTLMP